MSVKKMLTKQVKRLPVWVTELDDVVINGKETVADLNIKLKAAEKRAGDVAYERDGLEACLQHSQRGLYNVVESSTRL